MPSANLRNGVRRAARSGTLVLLLAIALPLAAQEWGMQQYNSDNGLPQNSVLNLVLDEQGYAWMTTEGGLVRYDGNRPERITLPTPDGGPQRMRDIVRLGTDRFVVRDSHSRTFILEQGRVKPYGPMDGEWDPYPFCRGDMPTMEAYLFNMRHRWLGARGFDWQDYTKTLFRVSDHDWLATSVLGLLHMHDTTLVGVIASTTPHDRFFALNGHVFGFNAQNQPLSVDVAARTIRTITLIGVTPPTEGPAALFFDNLQSTSSTPTVRVGADLYVLRASAANDTLFATHVPIALPSGTDITTIAADLERGVVLVGTNTQGLFVYKRMPLRTLRCPPVAVDGNNISYVQIVLDSERVAVRGGGDLHVFNSAGCDTTSSGLERFHYLSTARDRTGRIWYGLDSTIMTYHPLTGVRERIASHTGRGTYPVSFLEDGDSM
ncbi:MAG TPA: hypothetical protein VHL57_01655, partial [Flavobacteriales bacterium]|nr:hypothetical protein [Flavobacteriales bacterium]